MRRSTYTVWVLLIAAAVVVAAFSVVYTSFIAPEHIDLAQVSALSTAPVYIKGIRVNVTRADTPELRTQGLSGHPGLGVSEGMLFIFPEEARHSFWMKDMLFSIDIIWISSEGRVVAIEKHASPDSFPRSFTPNTPAQYVLEVAAGFSDAHGISEGDRVEF